MFESVLFLGFPVDAAYSRSMKGFDSKFLELFFQSDYLSEVTHEGVRYLGKFADPLSINEISLLQSNIYSILKKMVPSYPYEKVPLILFATEKPA